MNIPNKVFEIDKAVIAAVLTLADNSKVSFPVDVAKTLVKDLRLVADKIESGASVVGLVFMVYDPPEDTTKSGLESSVFVAASTPALAASYLALREPGEKALGSCIETLTGLSMTNGEGGFTKH